jgi:CBS domain-containing protein
MKVRDIMTTEVATAAPDTTLEELATMMRDENVGSIPIVDDEELVGIVTDRDIVVRCIAEGKDPSEVTAEEISTDELETVSPSDDVRRAADIMGRRQIRRLPVVDDGELVGIVALGDIAVKESGDEASGEALEEISAGVKGGRKSAQSSGGRQQAGRGRSEERGERTFEEEEETEMAQGRRSSGRTAQAAGFARGGTRAVGASTQAGKAARNLPRNPRSEERGKQGISNRSASREAERQQKVSPKRAQAERGGRKRRAG